MAGRMVSDKKEVMLGSDRNTDTRELGTQTGCSADRLGDSMKVSS